MPPTDGSHTLVPVFDMPKRSTRAEITRTFLDNVDLPPRVRGPLLSALRDLHDYDGGVNLPVVETPVQGSKTDGIGSLIQLRIVQEREYDDSSSSTSIRIAGVDFFGKRHIGTIEQALHTVLSRQGRDEDASLHGTSQEVTVTCQRDDALINGTSFQLGLGGLVLSRLVSREMKRVRVRMTHGVGITGGLSPDGAATQVDSHTLDTKVEAAFFSPLRTLAVPYGQESAAAEMLHRLQARFPNRDLHVVGVRSLPDILDRRRLTQRTEISRVQHATSQARANWGVLAGVALVSALIAVLAYVLLPPQDQTPVRGRYSGSVLTVENRAGQVIEEVEVGSGIVRKVRAQRRARPHAFPQTSGEHGVGFVWAARDSSGGEVIRSRPIGTDQQQWEIPVAPQVQFPQKPFANEPTYGVEDIYAANTDGEPGDEIYALFCHSPYFPALLVEIDAQTGDILQAYVHPGHLTARIRHVDLDGNNQPELVTGGYSNAFDGPVVIALNAEDFNGHGPVTAAYTPAETVPAQHYKYLLLPSSPVQRVAGKTNRLVRSTRILEDGVRVQVEDGTWGEDGLVSEIELFVRFDSQLNPVSVVPNSQHERLAQELVAEGRLDAVPGPQAFRTYLNEIKYWDGTSWKHAPSDGMHVEESN
ncbi:hypothetical protein CRI94_16415 [Longibacter salinarum]|uniref:Uncharacterized protein n=1 Tax=Longibacter salinarum TaxID=1850348 RepID=A0A2A8CTW4_9BACT|nr:hypothetical protein [Longibacter salinarum]PEN11173.1 hypothetical protein CRI94_16415 [Longibacter salinarum]